MPTSATGWFVFIVGVIILSALTVLGYFMFLEPVSPLVSARLVKIELAGTGGPGSHLLSTREFCTREEGEAEAIRSLRRMPTAGELEEVYETTPVVIHLLKGCHTRSRRIDLPEGLVAGRYVYETTLRWCNSVRRCQNDRLAPVTVLIDGLPGRHTLTIE